MNKLKAIFYFFVLLQVTTVQAATINVNCDGGDSLQATIDISQVGDVIDVAGTCYGQTVIRKDNLTIISSSNATIKSLGGAVDLLIMSNVRGTRLINLTVDGGRRGVRLINNSTARLVDINIINSETGIVIDTGSVLVAERVSVSWSSKEGVKLNLGSILKANAIDIFENALIGLSVDSGSMAALSNSFIENNLGSYRKNGGLKSEVDVLVTLGAVVDFIEGNTIGKTICDDGATIRADFRCQ